MLDFAATDVALGIGVAALGIGAAALGIGAAALGISAAALGISAAALGIVAAALRADVAVGTVVLTFLPAGTVEMPECEGRMPGRAVEPVWFGFGLPLSEGSQP